MFVSQNSWKWSEQSLNFATVLTFAIAPEVLYLKAGGHVIHMAVYLVHYVQAKCDKILFNLYLVVREFNLKKKVELVSMYSIWRFHVYNLKF